jgi:hypothetical protein
VDSKQLIQSYSLNKQQSFDEQRSERETNLGASFKHVDYNRSYLT